jgi:hypothetical protein
MNQKLIVVVDSDLIEAIKLKELKANNEMKGVSATGVVTWCLIQRLNPEAQP